MVLPTFNLPDEIKDFAENMVFFDGVGALEAQSVDSGQIKWPQEMVFLAREAVQMSGGMMLVDAHQPVPAYLISGILGQVKNKLLDFVLSLQESNITSEDLDNRTLAPEIARNLFYINVYGDRNIVASGEQVTQQANPVERGDIDSLIKFLRELNLGDDDLREIENAVSSEPDAPGGRLGPKVGAWLGGMILKAASRTWDIGVETASKALTRALNDYYGQ